MKSFLTIDLAQHNLFFTSDEHYGHDNIIKHCQRPFRDSHQMNTAILSKHNQVVKPKDLVIHLGDFSFKKTVADEIRPQLSGRHIFITGNHDKGWLQQWKEEGIDVYDMLELKITNSKTGEDQFIACCHYPLRSWNKSHHGSWNLFGHCHGTIEPIGLQLDVGVDCHGYGPISFDEVNLIMSAAARHEWRGKKLGQPDPDEVD